MTVYAANVRPFYTTYVFKLTQYHIRSPYYVLGNLKQRRSSLATHLWTELTKGYYHWCQCSLDDLKCMKELFEEKVLTNVEF